MSAVTSPIADFTLIKPPRGLPARLIGLAERLTRTLAVARALVMAGRPLDLTGFDDGIGMLCAQTLDLPTEDARAMRPVLLGLMENVNQLAEIFTQKLGPDHASPPTEH